MKYRDPETGEEFWPHVIEPSLGVDRTLLAVLLSAYHEDGDPAKSPDGNRGASRVVLKLKPKLAPYKAAVFPLLANKPDLVKKAREIYDDLRGFSAGGGSAFGGMVAWDDRGNIGKRYYAQDEIGTPYCITVDFDTLGEGSLDGFDKLTAGKLGAGKDAKLKGTVTVRDRDTAKQERVDIKKLSEYLAEHIG